MPRGDKLEAYRERARRARLTEQQQYERRAAAGAILPSGFHENPLKFSEKLTLAQKKKVSRMNPKMNYITFKRIHGFDKVK